jgi:hypothetical protein
VERIFSISALSLVTFWEIAKYAVMGSWGKAVIDSD